MGRIGAEPIPPLLTVKQAAELLGVTTATVYTMVRNDEVRWFKPLPRKTYVYEEDIQALIDASKGGAAPAVRELTEVV